MTTTSNTALSEILEVARSAVAAGDSSRARNYFRNLTEIDPTMVEAWLGYAACTTVLAERRALYTRALELDAASAEGLQGLARVDAMLAAGQLLYRAEQTPLAAPIVEHLAPAVPAALAAVAQTQRAAPRNAVALALVGLIGFVVMGMLTGFGIFVLTSFWGFLLAFIAGPAVSELIVRASARLHKRSMGRPLQIATGAGMILGGLGALAAGSLLMQLVGAPLPVEAVQIAQRIGVGTDPASVLLNNPGLLVFISSAVAATVYRIR